MTPPDTPLVAIACDKFKGSLTAIEACQAIAQGLPKKWNSQIIPIADGGEGFADTMKTALGGESVTCKVRDPLGRIISANYAICPTTDGPTAIMEMAEASGLHRVTDGQSNIMQSSTYGTGEMILDAHARDVSKIIIGIGGSATNDGGCGMARALGAKFYDRHDKELKAAPNELREISRVDTSDLIELPPITVACDVDNPLYGANGAAAIFGPQKGATDTDITALDAMLERVARVLKRQDFAKKPGAGAAGGLGFGLMVFAKAELIPGFDLVSKTLGLEEALRKAQLVITGEGSLDAQTLQGKGPAGVAMLARDLGLPVIGVAGRVTPHVTASRLFDHTISLEDTELPHKELMANAADLITNQLKKAKKVLKKYVTN